MANIQLRLGSRQPLQGANSRFGVERMRIAALTFEAGVDASLAVFSVAPDRLEAGYGDGRKRQPRGTQRPGPSRWFLEVAQESFELHGASGALGQGFPSGLGVGALGRLGGGVATRLGGGGERSDHWGKLPRAQQQGSLGQEPLAEMLKALVFVAKQPVEGGPQEALSQAVEGEPKLGQWIGARSRKVYR
jgi:hypothetical protein